MRVLVVSDVCGKIGGAYLATLNLCKALARQGHEVRCLATHFDGGTELTNAGFSRIGPLISSGHRWNLPGRSLVYQARVIHAVLKPKLVVCVGLTSLATQTLRTFPRQSVYVWELTNATPGNKFVDPHIHGLLGNSKAILSPSNTIDHNIRKTYGYSGPIQRLPFWTEPTQHKQSNALETITKIHDFLFLGRRDPEKGIKELIHATASLLSKFPYVRVGIAGAGDPAQYIALANSLKIPADNVYFLTLPNHSDALAELAKSKYLVLPSYHEGYPLSLLEAAEYGVPFIASDVGSIAEVYGGSLGCHIIPPRDSVALASAMEKALLIAQADYVRSSENLQRQYQSLCSDQTVMGLLSQLVA